MKKESPISGPAPERASTLLFSSFLISLCVSGFAAQIGTWFAAPNANATVELDQKYSLQTVGLLRATDNVDGLFADYVARAYQDYFSKQSRFVVQDLSKANSILTQSSIPYAKLVQDPKVLREIARVTRSQTLIRTQVLKEGDEYRFTMEWLQAPKMIPLATQTMVLNEPHDGMSLGVSDVQSRIENALAGMLHKIPWLAEVTGREGNQVTVNIGANAQLHKGDTLIISTLDDVRYHPLLHKIVAWKLTRTGEVELETVDDSIAFGRVTEEEPDRRIQRYQKVTRIIPASNESSFQVINASNERKQAMQRNPRLGFIRASLWPGGYSRQYNSPNSSSSRDGGGLFLGAKLNGELWLTSSLFSEMEFGYGFWSYGQHPTSTAGSDTLSGGANVFSFKFDAGYSYLWSGDFTGPKAFAKLGYRHNSYSLPSSSTEAVGPISFNTLFIGLGGDLPVRYNFGVDLDFDIGIANGVTQTGFSDGDTTSTSSVAFSLGAYYRLSNRLSIRGALEVLAQSADFTDQASIDQKIITLTPSLVYYF